MSLPTHYRSSRAKTRSKTHWRPTNKQAIRVLMLSSVLLAAQLSSCGSTPASNKASSLQAVPISPSRQDRSEISQRNLPTTSVAAPRTSPDTSSVPDSPSKRENPSDSVDAESPEFQIVARLLAEYSQVVTDLAAHPDATSDPLSAPRLQWAALVAPESSLSSDVLNQLVVIPAADKTRVLPAATGLSYSYRPVKVGTQAERVISFSWCGYSPGVRVAQGSEIVLDDAVAQLQGTGSVRELGSSWVIESLDHLDLTVLPAGTVDPCPASTSSAPPK